MMVAASASPVVEPAASLGGTSPVGFPSPALGGASTAKAAPKSPVRTSGAGAGADAMAGAQQLRVAQFNVYNMFDHVNNPHNTEEPIIPEAEYRARLEKIARTIANELGAPDVVSLNEIDNERVLNDLLARPELNGYAGILGDLNDARGIRTAMIYKGDRLEVAKVENFNPNFDGANSGKGQVDRGKLWARPPLAVDFKLRGVDQAASGVQNLTVVANHFKSKLGGAFHEPRRQAQGEQLGGFVDARRAATPGAAIVVLGDFNATPEDGAYARLTRTADGKERLYDAATKVRKDSRYTYNYRGRHDLLDHVFVTPELGTAITETKIPHFNTPKDSKKFRLDPTRPDGSSDHDPIVVDLDLSKVAVPATK
jgi:predicted extracellular nuclease